MLRAGLASVLNGANTPPLLILDEPTNHLNLDSIEAVEAGLRAYDGALRRSASRGGWNCRVPLSVKKYAMNPGFIFA